MTSLHSPSYLEFASIVQTDRYMQGESVPRMSVCLPWAPFINETPFLAQQREMKLPFLRRCSVSVTDNWQCRHSRVMQTLLYLYWLYCSAPPGRTSRIIYFIIQYRRAKVQLCPCPVCHSSLIVVSTRYWGAGSSSAASRTPDCCKSAPCAMSRSVFWAFSHYNPRWLYPHPQKMDPLRKWNSIKQPLYSSWLIFLLSCRGPWLRIFIQMNRIFVITQYWSLGYFAFSR